MFSSASDLRCPKCRSVTNVFVASSRPEKFQPPDQAAPHGVAVPFGAFVLAYLLGSMPFLAGSVYEHLSGWPAALSMVNYLLPKPLLSAAIGAVVLIVALDRLTRPFLRSMGRAAALDPRLYESLDAGASSLALSVVPAGVAGLGWAAFLGSKSLDSWLAMSTAQPIVGPDWVPLAGQGFLAGGMVGLAGLPLMAFIMARAAPFFAEYGVLQRDDASFSDFARNLAYPYVLLPVGMGFSMSSGLQLLSVVAVCWFLAATFVATRHTVKQDTELAVPVALVGAVPVILGFFIVKLRIQSDAFFSNWALVRGQTSTLPDLESYWLVTTLALAGLLVFAALLATALTKRNNAQTKLARQEAETRWQHLLYCERCDGVHLPDQKEFVPASQASALLLSGGDYS